VRKKILLLSVSAGAGHVRAAQALAAWAALRGDRIETLHLDVMEFAPLAFRKVYADFYLKLVSDHPQLWGLVYRHSNDARPNANLQKLRRAIERLSVRRLHKAISGFAPDAIICTHFLPAEILRHETLRERLRVPIWVQVTDFDLHRMWVMSGMSGYFVGNDELKARLIAHGVAPEAVHVTGIPVMPAFGGTPALDRAALAPGFGMNAQRVTVMLMGGGAGIGSLAEIAAELLALPQDFQLVVLAGRNAEALAALQALQARHPLRLFPYGFTDQVAQLMACADLVVTKPGGLSTSEALAMHVPMILNEPIPGQEEHNADFLLEEGVALKALDVLALKLRVAQLIDRPEQRTAMREWCRRLARPRAASDALDIVLASLI